MKDYKKDYIYLSKAEYALVKAALKSAELHYDYLITAWGSRGNWQNRLNEWKKLRAKLKAREGTE